MIETEDADRSRLAVLLSATLDGIRETGDLSLSLQAGPAEAVVRLSELLDDRSADEAWNPVGWFHWYRHLASPDHEEDHDLAVNAFLRADALTVHLAPRPAYHAPSPRSSPRKVSTARPGAAATKTSNRRLWIGQRPDADGNGVMMTSWV